MEEKHLLSQRELSDLIHHLNLSKQRAELLASRLQEWKHLDPKTQLTIYRNRNLVILPFFKKENDVVSAMTSKVYLV